MRLEHLPLWKLPRRDVAGEVADAWAFLCRRFDVRLVYGFPCLDSTPGSLERLPWATTTIVVRPTLTPAQQHTVIAHLFTALASGRLDFRAMQRDVAAAVAS